MLGAGRADALLRPEHLGQCDFAADGYRLPTEAEWEYACRAGSTTKYCFGDADAELPAYAWFKPHSQGRTQPVGQKPPNRWGLYDMHGNVWQWCNDWYGENYYKAESASRSAGPATGKKRVLRGGAWDCTPEKCRSAVREKEFPVYSDACFGEDKNGFRRARTAMGLRGGEVVKRNEDGESRIEDGNKAVRPSNAEPLPDGTTSPPHHPTTPVPLPETPNPALAKLKGTIIFVSDCTGTLKIWSVNANGKNAKQLTKGADPDADPRFSSDGMRIMYTTLRGGFPEIWMMNRDGSEPKFVTKGREGAWSPDGKSIVFIHDNQTFIRDLASGKESLVTPKEWERCGVPAFSPDGQRIAVASRHTGDIGIYILSLDGKENRPLKTEDACCTPQWSKDGKRIICQSVKGHIHQIGVDGKDWEQVTFGNDVQHDGRYSPDGSMILFCRVPAPEGPWQICVKRIEDEKEFVQITTEGSNSSADWCEDE